jgi:hypothetical protein
MRSFRLRSSRHPSRSRSHRQLRTRTRRRWRSEDRPKGNATRREIRTPRTRTPSPPATRTPATRGPPDPARAASSVGTADTRSAHPRRGRGHASRSPELATRPRGRRIAGCRNLFLAARCATPLATRRGIHRSNRLGNRPVRPPHERLRLEGSVRIDPRGESTDESVVYVQYRSRCRRTRDEFRPHGVRLALRAPGPTYPSYPSTVRSSRTVASSGS